MHPSCERENKFSISHKLFKTLHHLLGNFLNSQFISKLKTLHHMSYFSWSCPFLVKFFIILFVSFFSCQYLWLFSTAAYKTSSCNPAMYYLPLFSIFTFFPFVTSHCHFPCPRIGINLKTLIVNDILWYSAVIQNMRL